MNLSFSSTTATASELEACCLVTIKFDILYDIHQHISYVMCSEHCALSTCCCYILVTLPLQQVLTIKMIA